MAGLSASTGNYIASYTVTGSASSGFTFANIPQTYTDLLFVISGPGDTGASIVVRPNGDASTNYSRVNMYGNGTNAYSGRAASESGWYWNTGTSSTVTSSARINIMSYSNPNMFKTVLTEEDVGSSNPSSWAYNWRSYNPITSLVVTGSAGGATIAVGTTITLYGFKAADTTVAIPTKAFGGDSIVTDGTYIYHTFLYSGIFTPSSTLSCDVLMLSGGGGGSNNGGIGSGGGGGSLYYNTSISLSSPSTVLVGAGGPADTTSSGPGTAGGTSSIGATSTVYSNGAAGASGSGGSGGGSQKVISGTTTTYSGGSGSGSGFARAGGGGAGAAGSNGSSNSYGGPGGNGLNTYASWALVTNTGTDAGYYGGGGGGGYEYNGSASNPAGGLGGGGRGGAGTTSPYYNAFNGVNNTGGGGGGCGGKGGIIGGTSGNGGSGIVIVRYAI